FLNSQGNFNLASVCLLSPLPLPGAKICSVYFPDDIFPGLLSIRAVFIKDLRLLLLRASPEAPFPCYLEILIS
ncbi:MAG: hypothetical protein J7L19_06820, partial [Dehalococcoidia bacterium]|nr:hypothetical protein [Dehalococcoidia bacterium]